MMGSMAGVEEEVVPFLVDGTCLVGIYLDSRSELQVDPLIVSCNRCCCCRRR